MLAPLLESEVDALVDVSAVVGDELLPVLSPDALAVVPLVPPQPIASTVPKIVAVQVKCFM